MQNCTWASLLLDGNEPLLKG